MGPYGPLWAPLGPGPGPAWARIGASEPGPFGPGPAAEGGRRRRPPPVSSIPLVFLGRLVLVMHSTLIGYAIGYLPNQDPPGYPGLLI